MSYGKAIRKFKSDRGDATFEPLQEIAMSRRQVRGHLMFLILCVIPQITNSGAQ